MSELKKCPFCGGESISTRWTENETLYGCENADCVCTEMSWATEKQWNTRPLESALEAENKRLTELLSKHVVGLCKCGYMANWPVCTKCGASYPALEQK